MVYVANMTDDNGDFDLVLVKLEAKQWTVIGSNNVYHDDMCDSGMTYRTIAHEGLSEDELKEIVAYEWQETHCQHSYDCCGHTYYGRPKLIFCNDRIALMSQGFHVNN